jgi:hypothetical protein
MSRCVVNVATDRFVRGQRRLESRLHVPLVKWTDTFPMSSPSHQDIPYAFKAWALKGAADAGFMTMLWADACIVPRDLTTLFERIERDGYWFSKNGWMNAEWTADSAYQHLGVTKEENSKIDHVVATAFGVCLSHPLGCEFFLEYLRLAQTGAFCGPWWNKNHPEYRRWSHSAPCGDATVRGHRHDQTAASVIAWKLGFKLTQPPKVFAYEGGVTDDTVLVADGNY